MTLEDRADVAPLLLETRDVEVSTEDWRDTDGPNNAAAVRGTSARPGRGSDPVYSGVSTHDAYDAKLEQHTHAAVADLGAGAVDELARQHGWSRLIWFGEPSLVSVTRETMHS